MIDTKFKYTAVDKNGLKFGYTLKPILNEKTNSWKNPESGEVILLYNYKNYQDDWKKSLKIIEETI